MAKIKTIFFDVGGVLLKKKYDFDYKVAEYLGIDPLMYKEKVIALAETNEAKMRWQAIDNLESEKEFQDWFNQTILQKLALERNNHHINYLSHFRLNRTAHYELIEGVLETLDYLKQKYQLAIISNAPPSRRHFELKDFDLEKYFDPIILSGEIQKSKPGEEIFQIALKLAGLKAKNSVLVDNKVENLQGAKKLGFGLCLLYNFDQIDQSEFPAVDDFVKFKDIL